MIKYVLQKFTPINHGFTVIETVVMLAIVMTISAVVLSSFTGLSEGGAINRASRELALTVRRAQNMALAVTQIPTSSGPLIPPAVGLKLDRGNPSSYFLFADIVPDNKYNEANDAKIGQDEIFPQRIKINLLTGAIGTSYPVAHIIFTAPEAVATLSDGAGSSLGEQLEIELITSSGQQKKKVTIRTSGQVGIK